MAVSSLFPDPNDIEDELKKQLLERQKKALASGRVGSPGKITTLLGYSGQSAQQEQ